MSLNTEFGITLRTKGIDEALKKLNALGKQADKATSAGQRFEKMWNGLSSAGVRFEKNWSNLTTMVAGLETKVGRLGGASSNVMRQQQNMYQSARVEMVKLASAQNDVVNGFGNIEKKAKSSTASFTGLINPIKISADEQTKRLVDYQKSLEKRINYEEQKPFQGWPVRLETRTISSDDLLFNLAKTVWSVGRRSLVAPFAVKNTVDETTLTVNQKMDWWNNAVKGISQDLEVIDKKIAGYKKGKEYHEKLRVEWENFENAVGPGTDEKSKRVALHIFNDNNQGVIRNFDDTEGSIIQARNDYENKWADSKFGLKSGNWMIDENVKTQLTNVDKLVRLYKRWTSTLQYVGHPDAPYSDVHQEGLSREVQTGNIKVDDRKIDMSSDEAIPFIRMTNQLMTVVSQTAQTMQSYNGTDLNERNEQFAGVIGRLKKRLELSIDWPGKIPVEERLKVLEHLNRILAETAKNKKEYYNESHDLAEANGEIEIGLEEEKTQAVGEQTQQRTALMERAAQKQVKINNDSTSQILDSFGEMFDGWEEGYKSQADLSKAITLETKDAIDESRDYQFKYYDGLYGETQDYFDFRIDLTEQETQIVEDQTGEQTRIVQKATQEQARIQESGTVQMLKSWADMTQGWDQIAMNALDGIQQTLYQTFHSAFSGVGDAWDNLWDGMKNIAYQVLASIATKMAKGLVGNVVMNFIPGTSGGGGNMFGGNGNLFGNGMDYGQMSNFMGYGPTWLNDMTSGFTGATNYGAIQGDWAGINMDIGGATGTAGSAAGTAGNWGAFSQGGMASAGAVAGAAISAYSLYQLYENGPGGAEGAMQGMMTGAMGGAGFGPWGVVIGAAIGALAGGLGGGGNEDVEDRINDAKRFGKIAKELTRQSNLDEDVDVDKYLEAINAAHRSDNRVDSEAMWTLYSNLKSKGDLPWWAGDPGQIAHIQGLQGTEWGQPDWMRYRLFGKGGLPDETGDSGMAQWFGGEGEGPWGSDGGWDKVKGALDEMDNETLDRLGEALFNVKEGAAAFGIDMAELMGTFDMAQLESGEWATILKDELTPASLMAAMNDQLRAEGMTNLEIASQKQAAAIDSLLGTFNMSEEDTDSWVEQLFKANAEQADLSAKMEEYQDIVEQLQSVKAGEEETTKELIERGRALREELGLGESAFSKIEEGFETFVTAMEDIAKRLIDAAGSDVPSNHHGGMIYHSGGMVGAMLSAGLITPHGGMTRMHSGGLRPDERLSILQAGEYVIQRSSVNPATLATLRSINATGRLPMEQISQAMRRMSNTPKFHSGGPVAPLPATSSAPQPQGGDNGRPVTINFNPQISVNAESGADAAKIEAAVTKALEKSRVALKRQLEQTGYQVVDAQ